MDDLDGKGIFAPAKRRKYRGPSAASRMTWGKGQANNRRAQKAARLNAFAEALARNVHLDGLEAIETAAQEIGLHPGSGRRYFTEIRKALGPQAQ